MLFDPAYGLVQQERLGFGILRKWNPARDQPSGGFQRILSGNEEQRADLYRRFLRVVDISDQQSLGDKVHDRLFIRGSHATSRENLALSRCGLFHVNAILAVRGRQLLYKERSECPARP
jgi:hypothetical protein